MQRPLVRTRSGFCGSAAKQRVRSFGALLEAPRGSVKSTVRISDQRSCFHQRPACLRRPPFLFRQERGERTGQGGGRFRISPPSLDLPLIQTAKRGSPLLEIPARPQGSSMFTERPTEAASNGQRTTGTRKTPDSGPRRCTARKQDDFRSGNRPVFFFQENIPRCFSGSAAKGLTQEYRAHKARISSRWNR